MKNAQQDESVIKTIRIDVKTIEKIQQYADENERDFSSQVRFILKEYIRQKETK